MKQKSKVCKLCNKEFVANSNRQLYCSRSCKDKAYWRKKHPLEEKTCLYCEKPFKPEHNNTKCCSKGCSEELHRINAKKRMFKLRRDHPERVYTETGSKGTSTSYEVIKDENGVPDFKKEGDWLKNEKKRLGL